MTGEIRRLLARMTATLFVVAAIVSASSPGRADAVSCAATAENAQSLRQKRKLVEAQKQLVACASADCPKFVRADCLRWLDELQATLPTIVVRAQDTSGNDVLEGNVIIDGGPGAALGAATPLDPGPHVLTVKRGSDVGELRVMVAEGEKNRVVVVKLEGKSAPATATAPPGSTTPPPTATAPGPEPRSTSSSGRGPAPWIAGGIGVAGLVAFGVLQVAAQSQYDTLKERCAPSCEGSEVDAVRSKVTLSAVALGVGVVGVGTGIALWFALDAADASTNGNSRARRGIRVGASPTSGGAAGSIRVSF